MDGRHDIDVTFATYALQQVSRSRCGLALPTNYSQRDWADNMDIISTVMHASESNYSNPSKSSAVLKERIAPFCSTLRHDIRSSEHNTRGFEGQGAEACLALASLLECQDRHKARDRSQWTSSLPHFQGSYQSQDK
eukprot:2993805-Amphidinium_carterae.1